MLRKFLLLLVIVYSHHAVQVLGDCKSGWTEIDGYCYQLLDANVGKYSSQDTCHELGGDLATIFSYDHLQNIKDAYSLSTSSHKFWIGLSGTYTVVSSEVCEDFPMYPSGSVELCIDVPVSEWIYTWDSGHDVNFTSWKSGEPDAEGSHACVRIDPRTEDMMAVNCSAVGYPYALCQERTVCGYDWLEYEGQCYKTVAVNGGDWSDTETLCGESNAVLATIKSDEHWASIKAFSTAFGFDFDSNRTWIGLKWSITHYGINCTTGLSEYIDCDQTFSTTDDVDDFLEQCKVDVIPGIFSYDCADYLTVTEYGEWAWQDGSEITYTNWGSGQPDSSANSRCAQYGAASGQWYDRSCNYVEVENAVCQKWFPNACGSDWFELEGKCYKVLEETETATEAWNTCSEENAYAGSVQRADHWSRISALTSYALTSAGTWIGLYLSDNGPWTYISDGAEPGYTNWKTDECDSDWLEYEENCYKTLELNVDWNAAETVCAESHAILATIKSEEHWTNLTAFTNDFGIDLASTKTWIGLRYTSSTNWTWQDDSEISYTNWDSGQPDSSANTRCVYFREEGALWHDLSCGTTGLVHNAICQKPKGPASSSSPCVYVNKNGLWRDADCDTTTKQFLLCEKEIAVECEDDFIAVDSLCYSVVDLRTMGDSNRTWEGALDVCKSLRATLGSVSTDSTWLDIRGSLNYPDKSIWIGLSDLDDDGELEWADGHMFNFTDWSSGYSVSDCAGKCVYYYNDEWYCDDCETKDDGQFALCQKMDSSVFHEEDSTSAGGDNNWMDDGARYVGDYLKNQYEQLNQQISYENYALAKAIKDMQSSLTDTAIYSALILRDYVISGELDANGVAEAWDEQIEELKYVCHGICDWMDMTYDLTRQQVDICKEAAWDKYEPHIRAATDWLIELCVDLADAMEDLPEWAWALKEVFFDSAIRFTSLITADAWLVGTAAGDIEGAVEDALVQSAFLLKDFVTTGKLDADAMEGAWVQVGDSAVDFVGACGNLIASTTGESNSVIQEYQDLAWEKAGTLAVDIGDKIGEGLVAYNTFLEDTLQTVLDEIGITDALNDVKDWFTGLFG